MHIFLFGETRIESDGRVIHARQLGGVKPRLLLEYLAVHAGQPVSKSRIIEVLWANDAPAGAVATMETYVSLLRRILQPRTSARDSVIRTVTGGYCLDAEAVSVDLRLFQQLARRATREAGRHGTDALNAALDLVTGDLLASDATVPWVDQVRADFLSTLARTCTEAADHALGCGDHATVTALSRRALDIDPYLEQATRHLMTALWRSGRRGEALREYERLRMTLVEDLGVEPATETRDLHLAVLVDDEQTDVVGGGRTDEDSLVLELVRQVRIMVRERGAQETRTLMANLAVGAA